MTVRCGNRQAHQGNMAHHDTVAQVKLCFSRGAVASLEETQAVTEAVAAAQPVADETCEHGMAAWLCAGPNHYPADDPNSPYEHMSTPELMRATSDDYHRRGENCPWDCSLCPGNIAADEAERSAEMAAEAEVAQVADTSTSTHAPYDGIYVIENPPSGLSHRTFRLKTQGPEEKFAPGRQVIAYQSGPDNESDYTGFGFVDRNALGYFVRVWKSHHDNQAVQRDAEVLLKDTDPFLTEAHCFRCGRRLTVPASVHAGYGSECAKKV